MNASKWWRDDMDAWNNYTEALKASKKPGAVFSRSQKSKPNPLADILTAGLVVWVLAVFGIIVWRMSSWPL